MCYGDLDGGRHLSARVLGPVIVSRKRAKNAVMMSLIPGMIASVTMLEVLVM